MSLSKKAVLEIHDLSDEALRLARGSASERAQAQVIQQRINTIKETGLSSDECRALYVEALVDEGHAHLPARKEHPDYRAKFDSYLKRKISDEEFRDFVSGTQTLSWTQGAPGGYFVPIAYDPKVREAMAQVDPLLDPDVTDFTMTGTPTLQPSIVSGWDLSNIAAVNAAEAAQQNPQSFATVKAGLLNANKIFKVTLAASYEAEIDIPGFGDKIVRACTVGLARKIGQSVVAGAGGTDISSVITGVPIGATQLTAGKLQLNDITNLFFSVNRYYRASAKCAWLADDGSYKFLRNAVDSSNRPLLSVEDSQETLMGKPVYVVPSLATGNLFSIGVSKALVFGDLSSIVIKASGITVQRMVEVGQADITKGQALYVGRCRADAVYFDPSNGGNPPLQKMLVS